MWITPFPLFWAHCDGDTTYGKYITPTHKVTGVEIMSSSFGCSMLLFNVGSWWLHYPAEAKATNRDNEVDLYSLWPMESLVKEMPFFSLYPSPYSGLFGVTWRNGVSERFYRISFGFSLPLRWIIFLKSFHFSNE